MAGTPTAGDPRDLPVTELERIAAAGWPGTEQERIGGWLLRAGGGFTSRANSALPLGPAGIEPTEALRRLREFYGLRGLTPRLQIPFAAADIGELDRWLEGRRWRAADEAAVLVAGLDPMLDRRGSPAAGRMLPTSEMLDAPSPAWLDGYRYRGRALPPSARDVLLAGGSPVFAIMQDGARRLGVARGIVTDGWLGVTALTVEPEARRRGVATAIMTDLGGWAARAGAHSVYLQVAAENEAAFALYDALGFTEHHRYHYRIDPEAATG